MHHVCGQIKWILNVLDWPKSSFGGFPYDLMGKPKALANPIYTKNKEIGMYVVCVYGVWVCE